MYVVINDIVCLYICEVIVFLKVIIFRLLLDELYFYLFFFLIKWDYYIMSKFI